MERMKDPLTLPGTATIGSIAASKDKDFSQRLAEARRRVEEIKRERLALQEGRISDSREEHYVKFEVNGLVQYRLYPAGTYYCLRCKDLEKIYYREKGQIRARPCSCVQERKQLGRQQSWEHKLNSARLRRKFRKRTFANFQVSPGTRIAYEAARDYAENFATYLRCGKSLIFLGDVGRGKTHLAAAILQEVLRQGFNGIFVVVIELLNEIRDTYERSDKTEGDLLQLVKEVDLLVLDDLAAAERFTEWEKAKLYEIINARYEDEKPIIITTNRTISWIEDRLGKKVVDRLLEMCGDVLPLDGENYREKIAEEMRMGRNVEVLHGEGAG
ncbi:MAG: ATP-binding protein [bacterium]|nr:ATP-binding protein [Bacillota bacterium]HHW54919.1 ATP-binding protein [Bacillota bacterium]